MSTTSVSIPAKWTTYLQSIARVIFGFLVLRRGMEQVLGYPDVSDAAMLSFRGILDVMSFAGGPLIMLGLLTRPVSLALSIAYLLYWFVGPLQTTGNIFGGRGPSDPVLLNGFFFLYLTATGPGAWSLDRLRNQDEVRLTSWWAPYALGALRIVAGFLFLHHGLEKFFGGRVPLDIISLRALAGLLEVVGGPLLMLGLFTRPLAFILSGEMAFAYFLNHAPDGFWGSFAEPNQEAAILNCYLFLFLWAAGSGAWSLDAVRHRRRERGGPTAEPAVNLETRAI